MGGKEIRAILGKNARIFRNRGNWSVNINLLNMPINRINWYKKVFINFLINRHTLINISCPCVEAVLQVQ
jgi:hypothetical protein